MNTYIRMTKWMDLMNLNFDGNGSIIDQNDSLTDHLKFF